MIKLYLIVLVVAPNLDLGFGDVTSLVEEHTDLVGFVDASWKKIKEGLVFAGIRGYLKDGAGNYSSFYQVPQKQHPF